MNKPAQFRKSAVAYAALRSVAYCAMVFCSVVAVLIAANALRVRAADPLNLEALKALRTQLHVQPGDARLQEQIRSVDLLARQAFFSSVQFARIGAGLLAGGAIAMWLALGAMSSLRRQLPDPGKFAGLPDFSAQTGWARLALTVLGLGLAGLTLTCGGPPRPLPAAPGPKVATPPAAAPAAAPGEDWPAFRGADGNAICQASNVPTAWDGMSGKGVLWKSELPLPGCSSPIVVGGRVYLTGASAEKREVYCYDGASGALLWRHAADGIAGSPAKAPDVSKDTGYAAPTMAGDGGRVFAIFATGELVALDRDGKRAWAQCIGKIENHYGHSSSLLASAGKLYVQLDDSKAAQVVALDAASGKIVWTAKRTDIAWSSPILVNTGKRRELILTCSSGVDSYDPETGTKLWDQRCLSAEVGTSAAYADGMVFAGNEFTVACGIQLEGSNGTPKVAWEFDEDLPDVASPLAVGGLVFFASGAGVMSCLDAKTGKVQWSHRFDEGFWASPLAVGNRVYALDRKGRMHLIEVAREFKSAGPNELGEESTCTPAIVNGRVYMRSVKSLFCIGDALKP